MKPIVICLLLASQFFIGNATAQETPFAHKKGAFYFYWGYNRSFFSKTNLHFTGPNYDFTVYDIKAADKPSKFGWVYFNPGTFTVPQYVARLGYFITDKLAFSLGMDHMKYVVEPYQSTTISGVITPKASPTYSGTYLNEPIQLKPELLVFEHTNGFNLVSLDFEYLLPLRRTWPGKFSVHWNTGFGGIWIVTKTDVRVLGDGLDNDFHVAGFTFVGKTGPRIEFKNRVFLAGELKGGYASLPSVLIKNAEPEIGDHNLSFLEWNIAFGFNFGGRKKSGVETE
ncbi:MAG: hypothetical protein H6574_19155 [Lewinellaceae bacterium]|nr:hypothetical protein [Lewinellaceae bacterium]MCB9333192.1 hypothetical protein [Lewinellaceae bacterium]